MSKPVGQTSPTTRCRRCKRVHADHITLTQACPDGSGRTWLAHADRGRASTSFNRNEVALLNELLLGVTQRKDLSLLVKRMEFGDVASKVKRLSERSKETAARALLVTPPRDVERRVQRAMSGRHGNFTSREIASEIGASFHSVSSAIQRLKSRGVVRKVKHGVWCKSAPTSNVTPITAALKAQGGR